MLHWHLLLLFLALAGLFELAHTYFVFLLQQEIHS